MAETYIGVNNVAKKVGNIYVGVNNVAKKVTSAYIGVNNVAKLVYSPSVSETALCFTAVEPNSSVMLGSTVSTSGTITRMNFEYKVNSGSWNTYTLGVTVVPLPQIGDKVYIRAVGSNDFSEVTYSIHLKFTLSGKVSCKGNIMSLVENSGLSTIIPVNYCFVELFKDCVALTSAPALNATNLKNSCYDEMFSGCTNLVDIEPIPTVVGSYGAFTEIFRGCTSLAKLPKLETTDITTSLYNKMFYGCTNIKLSTTQTGIYTNAYKIPFSNSSSSVGSSALESMFTLTGGTFTGTPSADTIYYTNAQLV